MNEIKVEILVYPDRCVWINDRRVAGKKTYISENIKPTLFTTTLSSVLDSFSIEDIKEYIDNKSLLKEEVNQ